MASPNESVRVQRFFQFIDSSPAAVGIDRTRSDTKPSPLSAHLDGQLALPIPLPARSLGIVWVASNPHIQA